MFFILFRNFPSLLLLIFLLAFLLSASYLLQLSSYLSRLSSPPPLSFSLSISRVSPIFHPFSFYTSRASLSPSYPRTVFYFSFSLYLPSPLCLYLSSDRSSGTAIPQAIYRAAAVSLGDSRLYTGLMGVSAQQWFCVRAQRNHHLNARHRQPVQKFLARL